MFFDRLRINETLTRTLFVIRNMQRGHKQRLLLIVDLAIAAVAFAAAILLDVPTGAEQPDVVRYLMAMGLLISATAILSSALGLPKVQLKSYESHGMALSGVLGAILGAIVWALNAVIP